MLPLTLDRLSVRHLRNLSEVDVDPSPRFNVFFGNNGHGKTNLLEAIYLLCTGKSFRTSNLGDLAPVLRVAGASSVRGRFRSQDSVVEQSIGLLAGKRHARVDSKRPKSLAEYATRVPVVVFHPGELSLSIGPSGERRKVLDRISLYTQPNSLAAIEDYRKALRARQKTLEVRGTTARELDQWEELVVTHGLNVTRARTSAAERLIPEMMQAFVRVAAADIQCGVRYAPKSPSDREEYRRQLKENRALDAARGVARVGPHRDDLVFEINGQAARSIASQGQHRALVLALKSAELRVVGNARSVRPILLLDDVSSELDPDRTIALFALLAEEEGQVFLTTTRREIIAEAFKSTDLRRDFLVEQGRVCAVP